MLGHGQASRDIAAAAGEDGMEEEGDQEEGEGGRRHQGQACRDFWGNEDDDGLSRPWLAACAWLRQRAAG